MARIITILVFIFVHSLQIGSVKIFGSSMEPNYKNNQFYLVDKSTYKKHSPERGDIVLYNQKLSQNPIEVQFLGRIIGLPGEKLLISKNKIFINGQVITETYLLPETKTLGGWVIPEGITIEIPEDQYVILGDNRTHSNDSRNTGFVKRENILGKFGLCYQNCN